MGRGGGACAVTGDGMGGGMRAACCILLAAVCWLRSRVLRTGCWLRLCAYDALGHAPRMPGKR
jgi:hypothetical protein